MISDDLRISNTVIRYSYPTAIKHGVLGNPPFMDDFPSCKPPFRWDFPASHVTDDTISGRFQASSDFALVLHVFVASKLSVFPESKNRVGKSVAVAV